MESSNPNEKMQAQSENVDYSSKKKIVKRSEKLPPHIEHQNSFPIFDYRFLTIELTKSNIRLPGDINNMGNPYF